MNSEQILKNFGYENITPLSTYKDTSVDFQTMYLAKWGKMWRYVFVDKFSTQCGSTGESFASKKSAMASAYTFLTESWNFTDEEIHPSVKKAHQMEILGFEMTPNEIEALRLVANNPILTGLLEKLESIC